MSEVQREGFLRPFYPTAQILCFTMTGIVMKSSYCVISHLAEGRVLNFKRNVIDVTMEQYFLLGRRLKMS